MRQLLRNCPAMRIAHDDGSIEISLRQHGIEISGKRRHVIGTDKVAASAVPAKVRNEHPELVAQEFDEWIKHCARNHQAVQQQEWLTVALDAIEDSVGGAVLSAGCLWLQDDTPERS